MSGGWCLTGQSSWRGRCPTSRLAHNFNKIPRALEFIQSFCIAPKISTQYYFNPLKFNCICRSFNNGEDKSSGDDMMVSKIELVPSRYSLNN